MLSSQLNARVRSVMSGIARTIHIPAHLESSFLPTIMHKFNRFRDRCPPFSPCHTSTAASSLSSVRDTASLPS